MNRQTRRSPHGFQRQSLATLHSLQRAAYRKGLAAEGFQLCAEAKIDLGIFGTAQPHVRETAEVIRPRILAAASNGSREIVMRAAIVAGEVGMHASTIQVFKQPVLCAADRGEQRGHEGRTRQTEIPRHANDTPHE
jgi:hypothetical protein